MHQPWPSGRRRAVAIEVVVQHVSATVHAVIDPTIDVFSPFRITAQVLASVVLVGILCAAHHWRRCRPTAKAYRREREVAARRDLDRALTDADRAWLREQGWAP